MYALLYEVIYLLSVVQCLPVVANAVIQPHVLHWTSTFLEFKRSTSGSTTPSLIKISLLFSIKKNQNDKACILKNLFKNPVGLLVFFSPIHYICIKAANIYLNKQYLYSDKWLMKSYYQQIFRKPKSKKKKEEHLLGAESYVWWRPHVTDVGLTKLYYIIYIKSCPTPAHDNMCEQRFPQTSERLVQADYRSRLAIYILMFLCFSFIVLSILATTYRPTASTLHRPYSNQCISLQF